MGVVSYNTIPLVTGVGILKHCIRPRRTKNILSADVVDKQVEFNGKDFLSE